MTEKRVAERIATPHVCIAEKAYMAKKFCISDQTVNRWMGMKLVVLTSGISWERFKKNPVMLYMHNYDKLIGKWEDLELTGNEVYAKPVFNTKNAFAKEKQQEVTDGFLNGASLGLTPILWANGDEYGLDADVMVLAKSEANEVSLVTVGGNANALQLYKQDGTHYTEEDIKQVQLSLPVSQSNTKTKSNMDFKKMAAIALGLKAEATDEEVLLAVQNNAKQLKETTDKLTALQTAQAETRKKLIDDTIALAKSQGKIAGDNAADTEATYRELLNTNFELGMKMIANMPTTAVSAAKPADAVNLAQRVADTGKNTDPANDRTKWKLSDYMRNDPAAVELMKKEKKDEYIALCKRSGIDASDIQW